jgi:lysophospholipase L1-like esterase
MNKPLRAVLSAVALGTLCLAAACSSSSTSSTTTTSAPSKYYVSLGDSYSVGYQPNVSNPDTGHASSGYTGYVAKTLDMKLANFGCAGATTESLLTTIGCPDVLPNTAGVQTYPTTTQIAAATAFIKAHKGQIGLITVSISGNDVTACAKDASPVPCVAAATASITTNVSSAASQLRAAAGPGVQIIGTTYPDVLLGSYVYPTHPPTASQVSLAQLSVTAFKSLINPALKSAYATAQGSFVDVTAKTGAYIPLTTTVKNPTYGTIPLAVSNVCTLTWYCQLGNIHARTPGYEAIGKMIVASYKAAA